MNSILKKVDGADGYYDSLLLSEKDIRNLKDIVHEHYRSHLISLYPHLQGQIDDLEMMNYHELIEDNPEIDHSNIWAKKNRILPDILRERFKNLDFFRALVKELGSLKISNEEEIYEEEIYWRLTRPGNENDVGPMHADNWFWTLGHGNTPKGYRRIKLWISIYNESGKNGLRYVKSSHLKDWPYHGEERDGFIKPMIDISDNELDITKFQSTSGMAFIFNDKLLHGGFSGGEKSRISIECTLIKKID
jgi:hypothetical protein